MDKRFFNIFAKIYLYINDYSNVKNILQMQNFDIENKYQNFKNMDVKEIEKIVDELINRNLNDNDNDNDDMCFLYDLLLVIDYVYQSIQDDSLIKEDYLNTMYRDKIQLCSKNNNSINRISGAYPELSSYFKSIIPIIKKSNCLYEVNNYYLENNLEYIKIAIISGNILKESKKQEKILNSLKHALDNEHHVILCCEYAGSDEFDKEIQELVINYPSAMIIFSPSHLDGDNHNTTKIFYNEYNQIDVTSYSKHFPYTEKGIIKEDINIDDPKFQIFHINNIGILTTVICKDFFSTNTDEFINNAQIDLMLIMSKTSNYTEFANNFVKFVKNKRGIILCNDCYECSTSKQLKSPFLTSIYVKDSDKTLVNFHTYEEKINCCYKCYKYDICYLSLEFSTSNNNIRFSNKKHILE